MTSSDETIVKELVGDDSLDTPTLSDPEHHGYDEDFVNSVDPENVCRICCLVIRDAVQLRTCGHAFCHDCIDHWITRRGSTYEGARCPIDNQCITHNDIIEDKRLRRIILNLQVFCTNRARGCLKTPDLASLAAHGSRCLMAEIKCEFCQEMYLRHEAEVHNQSCLKAITPCQFHPVGCNVELRRVDVPNHDRASCQEHLSLLLSEMLSTRNAVGTAVSEVHNIRRQLELDMSYLKREVASLRVNLNDITATMRKFPNDINNTENELWSITSGQVGVVAGRVAETESRLSENNRKLLALENTLADNNAKQENTMLAVEKQLSELLEANLVLRRSHDEMKRILEEGEKSTSDSPQKIDKKLIDDLEKKVKEIAEVIKSKDSLSIFESRIEMRRGMKFRRLPTFYTHDRGYRLFVEVGHDENDDYYKFRCYITKGDYDNDLKWPMQGQMILSVVAANSRELIGSAQKMWKEGLERSLKDDSHPWFMGFKFKSDNTPQLVVVRVL